MQNWQGPFLVAPTDKKPNLKTSFKRLSALKNIINQCKSIKYE